MMTFWVFGSPPFVGGSQFAQSVFLTVVRSANQITSGLFGEATFKARVLAFSGGGIVRGSLHFFVSACPSAKEMPAAPLW